MGVGRAGRALMLPPPARGLGHPGEHKGSYLHCGFQAPHCFPVCGGSKGGGFAGGAATSLQEDKGEEWEARGACWGRIFSPFRELFPRGIADGNGMSDRCQ